MNKPGKLRIETTSMLLHIMAMLFMLCDHLWATVVPGNDWMTCVGRLFIFAVLSEIPFNLMMGSRKKGKIFRRSFVGVSSVVLAYVLGLLHML